MIENLTYNPTQAQLITFKDFWAKCLADAGETDPLIEARCRIIAEASFLQGWAEGAAAKPLN
jgi:hypothetical protein